MSADVCSPLKTCACGRAYGSPSWRELTFVGVQVHEDLRLELRRCACGSTLALHDHVIVRAGGSQNER